MKIACMKSPPCKAWGSALITVSSVVLLTCFLPARATIILLCILLTAAGWLLMKRGKGGF